MTMSLAKCIVDSMNTSLRAAMLVDERIVCGALLALVNQNATKIQTQIQTRIALTLTRATDRR